MSKLYHEGHRSLQRQFDSERLADRLEQVTYRDHLTPDDCAFIASRDMFFLATADAEGRPNCSYKGGDPGFVRIVDQSTIAFPHYDGNGMFLSTGNTLVNAHVGLLFIDFSSPRRLRVNGRASLISADELNPAMHGAQFVVQVDIREVFPNCPRYIHHYELRERSIYVPRSSTEPPVPAWKNFAWAKDVLPADDPARER